jgi:hypothetical protein
MFRRIHRHFLTDSGQVSSGAFANHDLSVNWEKYATADETAAQDPSGNTVAVVSIAAGFCRSVDQAVIHDPLPEQNGVSANPAHSLIRGRKSKPIKHKLRDASVVVWRKG